MAALQCDICGGKLMGRAGGVFECDSCGMQYDTAWAKEKIQEIRGTVKVEGTVEVAGTVRVEGPVKVDGGISVQSLCDRGFFELENGAPESAKDAFSRALDMDISWGDVYMGLIMCEFPQVVRNREEFRTRLLRHEFDLHRHFAKFLDNSGSSFHQALVAAYQELLHREKTIIAENHRHGAEMVEYYRSLRKKYSPVRGRITTNGEYILDKFGSLYYRFSCSTLYCYSYGNDFDAQTSWNNMIWIHEMDMRRTYKSMLIGMHADGTVIAENRDQRVEVFDPDDHIVEVLGVGTEDTQGFVGRKQDGSLVVATCGENRNSLREQLAEQKQSWKGKAVEGLCEFTNDYKLRLVVPSDDEIGDIAWTESGPYTDTGRSMEEHVFKMVANLRTDGTAFLTRSCHHTLDTQVALWSDLIQVVAGKRSVTGLKADGTLFYAYRYNTSKWRSDYMQLESIRKNVESWTDIVFIRMVKDDVIAVCKDGTLRTTISRYNGTFAAENEIQLFEDIDTLAEKIAADRAAAYSAWKQWRDAGAEEAQEEEIEAEDPYAEQREELEHQLEVIHRELEGLKGIFTMKRRRELEEKMGRILLELDELG